MTPTSLETAKKRVLKEIEELKACEAGTRSFGESIGVKLGGRIGELCDTISQTESIEQDDVKDVINKLRSFQSPCLVILGKSHAMSVFSALGNRIERDQEPAKFMQAVLAFRENQDTDKARKLAREVCGVTGYDPDKVVFEMESPDHPPFPASSEAQHFFNEMLTREREGQVPQGTCSQLSQHFIPDKD